MGCLLRRQHLDYDDCRGLGEIGMPAVYFLRQGASLRYQRHLMAQGMETGQYKPVRILDTKEKTEKGMRVYKNFSPYLKCRESPKIRDSRKTSWTCQDHRQWFISAIA
ncbi:MAG: GH3 auxin-responsive promoter family protein [Eubacterium sp.]|nr:GH3 auxin-responsive promoter family protein [Eubacterium sp.]